MVTCQSLGMWIQAVRKSSTAPGSSTVAGEVAEVAEVAEVTEVVEMEGEVGEASTEATVDLRTCQLAWWVSRERR